MRKPEVAMSDRFAVVVRLATAGQPAFQLRKGELGISVFDPNGVEPPLTEDEILSPFREGSVVVYRTLEQIVAAGLVVLETPGADVLPERLRAAHREIAPPPTVTRNEFKSALKRLEDV
jgi:hypothetical protein